MVVKSDKYKENDFILRTDTVIIVTSHPGHRMFLEAVLENYKRSGKYLICSYDSHKEWPHSYVMNIPHTWVTKPLTYGAGKRIGWLYDAVLAGGTISHLRNIKYVIITNGDCFWENPEKVDSLGEYIEKRNGDIMCVSSDSTYHTAAMVMKVGTFQSFMSFIVKNLRNNIPASYSPEVLLKQYIENNNIKYIHPEKQPRFPEGHRYAGKVDHYSRYNQDHTWKELVGYRNLGDEHKARCYEHLEPLPSKYFYMGQPPIYFDSHERDTLEKYFRSGDRRYLYMYWDRGEESMFNRRYHKINHYGDKPLRDDSKRKELGPMTERTGVFNRWRTYNYVLKDEEFETRWKKFIQEKYPNCLEGD
jgi:hypothetical protein